MGLVIARGLLEVAVDDFLQTDWLSVRLRERPLFLGHAAVIGVAVDSLGARCFLHPLLVQVVLDAVVVRSLPYWVPRRSWSHFLDLLDSECFLFLSDGELKFGDCGGLLVCDVHQVILAVHGLNRRVFPVQIVEDFLLQLHLALNVFELLQQALIHKLVARQINFVLGWQRLLRMLLRQPRVPTKDLVARGTFGSGRVRIQDVWLLVLLNPVILERYAPSGFLHNNLLLARSRQALLPVARVHHFRRLAEARLPPVVFEASVRILRQELLLQDLTAHAEIARHDDRLVLAQRRFSVQHRLEVRFLEWHLIRNSELLEKIS